MSTPPGFNNPNIAGRKIATPRRRLNRASSDMGGQGAPMPNFTFQPPGGVAPSFGGGASGTSGTPQPSFSGFNRSASAGSAGFQFSAPSQATPSQQQQPFVFGSQASGAQQQSNAPFQFGSGGSQPSSPSSFSFGSNTAAAATPAFGAAAPPTTTTTTSSTPGFGTSAPTTSSTSAAPSSPAQQPFKFGSPTSSPFGAGATSTTAITSPFGSPSLTPAAPANATTPSTPPALGAFGSSLSSTSSTTSPTASTFTFGASAQQPPSSPKVAGGFTFGAGGATAITTTGDSAMATDTSLAQPFSIGSTTTPATTSPSTMIKTPSFNFGSTATTEKPAATTTTTKPTTDKPAVADKPAFSFGSTSPKQGPSPFALTSTTTTSSEKSAPAMTTATTTSSSTTAAPTFNFGAAATTSDKPASSSSTTTTPSTTTTKPAFSFGTPASSTSTTAEKPPVAPKMPTFSFGSAANGEKDGSSETTSTSKDETTAAPVTTGSKRKTLDTAAAESARHKLRHGNSPLSQSWNADDEEQPATKRATTGLNDASNRLQPPSSSTEDKGKDKGSSDTTTTTSTTPTAAATVATSSAESDGKKRPLEGADNTGVQAKKVTFSVGESSSSTSSKKSPFTFGAKEQQQDGDKKAAEKKKDEKEGATTTTKEGDKENKPVNPFKPLESTPIEIPSSQASSSSSTAPKSQSTSSDVFGKPTPTDAEQTMIESKITHPDGIEKRTRYRELPGAAQTELDNLWWFIDQQVRMAKEIETRQLASNGELIRDLSQSVHRMSKDLTLLKEQHHITAQSIATLTESTEYQVQNASVAKAYSDHQNQGRRMEGGTTIHRRYFFDLVKSLNAKCTEYRNAINDIEDRMRELDQVVVQSPAGLADILRTQNETLIALAAQVADLHQQTEKLKA